MTPEPGQPGRVIETDLRGPVATITLNRPAARNAINVQLANELSAAITAVEAEDAVVVAVLQANGPAFCAGADLKALAAGEPVGVVEGHGFAGMTHRERFKPIVAAVEGPALAGGCEIVLACDLVVASTAARFGLPEVKRSLIAAAGGLIRLPRMLPRAVALELILTGEPMSAERAHALGMVNRLVEPGQASAAAEELANQIAVNAPLAVRASRRVVLESLRHGEAYGWELSQQLAADITRTEDYLEGPRAFAEKRDPQWKGR